MPPMTASTCAMCGRAFPLEELTATTTGQLCADCKEGIVATPERPLVSPLAVVGLVFGLAPFFLHFTKSLSLTVNGVVEQSHFDAVAVGGGALALVLGLAALVSARNVMEGRRTRLGIAAAIAALGVFQVLSGLGAL